MTQDFIKEAEKLKNVSDKAINSVTSSSKLNTAMETGDVDTLVEIIKDQNKTIQVLKDQTAKTNYSELGLTKGEEQAINAIGAAINAYRGSYEAKPEDEKPIYRNPNATFNSSMIAAQQAVLSCPVIRALAEKEKKKLAKDKEEAK